MQTTTLGDNGPRVSWLGFGVMQMAMKKPHNDQESIATIQTALDAGINFIDVADFYGMGRGEYLLGQALKGRRDQAFLSVKCGAMFSPTGAFLGVDGRPEAIRILPLTPCSGWAWRLSISISRAAPIPMCPMKKPSARLPTCCVAPIAYIRSARWKSNIRWPAVLSKRRSCPPRASWASPSCLTVFWRMAC
ncbi:aldo/keto reductase [Salmonella enterica]